MKTTRKKQRGGRFIDEGSYGCAFTDPPLPCWKSSGKFPRRKSTLLSKIMKKDLADILIEKNAMFRAIDSEEHYFISLGDKPSCIPVVSSPPIKDTDETDKCSIIRNRPPHIISTPQPMKGLRLLFFEMGGKDLNKLTLAARDYAPFFKSLINLLRGIQLAHNNNIVHLDIKPGNIVSKRLPSGEYQTRFIDYDLAHDLTKLTGITDAKLNSLNTQYAFWPFETMFVKPKNFRDMIPTPDDTVYTIEPKKNEMRPYLVHWGQEVATWSALGLVLDAGKPFVMSDTGPVLSIGTTIYMEQYAPSLEIIQSDYRTYLKTVDIYMLGVTLGLVMNRFFNYIFVCTDASTNTIKIAVKIHTAAFSGYVFVENLEANGFSKEIQDWHVNVQNNLLIPYAILINNMTSLMVNIRMYITAEVVIDIYENRFLPLFDALFTEDAINNYLVPLGAIRVDAQPPSPAGPSVPLTVSPLSLAVSPASSSSLSPKSLSNFEPDPNASKGGRRKTKRKRKTQRK